MLLTLANNQLNLALAICAFIFAFIPIVWSKYIFNEHPRKWYLKLKWGSLVLLIPAYAAYKFTNMKDELSDMNKDSTFVTVCNTVDVKFKRIAAPDSLKLILPLCSSGHIHGLNADLAFITSNNNQLQLYNLGKGTVKIDLSENSMPTITTNSFHISAPLTGDALLVLFTRLTWDNPEPNKNYPERIFLRWSTSDSTFNFLNDSSLLRQCNELLEKSNY
jgi:hypothetical protein